MVRGDGQDFQVVGQILVGWSAKFLSQNILLPPPHPLTLAPYYSIKFHFFRPIIVNGDAIGRKMNQIKTAWMRTEQLNYVIVFLLNKINITQLFGN